MSTVQVSRLRVEVVAPSTVQVSRVEVVSTPTSSTVQVSRVEVVSIANPTTTMTVEPFEVVTLPPGTWVQDSGPTVTLSGLTFIAPVPGVAAGAVAGPGLILVFSSGAVSVAVNVLPHTLFVLSGGVWVGVEIAIL